jgi:hypothetical protein
MKRFTIISVLLCAIALGQSIVGTYVRNFPGDSGSMMDVYRDSSGALQTRLTAVTQARRELLGEHVGDAELTGFQLDHDATAKLNSEATANGVTGNTVVYKAILCSYVPGAISSLVTVLYAPDMGIWVATGDGPPFNQSAIVEAWTPVSVTPNR